MARNGITQLEGNGRHEHHVGPAHIILVGQTGLDGVLATPEAAELKRVRSGTDALGEVSAWRQRHASGEQVVVLGEAVDADPTLLRARRFVNALRRLDPQIRVLAVGRPLEEEADPLDGSESFDGWLDVDDPVYSSKMLLRGARHGAHLRMDPGDDAQATPHDRPAAEVVAPEPTPPPADDGELARRLTDGQPIQAAAVRLASQRLAAPAELLHDAQASAGPGLAPLPGLPGRVLRAPQATGEALEAAAAWLAAWITLEDRLVLLERQASTDPLTGSGNRRHFDDTLARAIENAKEDRRDVSVLVFDIDDFKRFNDEHGHDAGDEILCETVRLLQSVIRPSDTVCRIGGDEFAVIFDDPEGPREPTSRHPDSVVDLAHRFQQQVATERFPKLGDDAPGRLTVSGGLATFPWDGLDPSSLLRVADQRALECKRQGKNAIELGPIEA